MTRELTCTCIGGGVHLGPAEIVYNRHCGGGHRQPIEIEPGGMEHVARPEEEVSGGSLPRDPPFQEIPHLTCLLREHRDARGRQTPLSISPCGDLRKENRVTAGQDVRPFMVLGLAHRRQLFQLSPVVRDSHQPPGSSTSRTRWSHRVPSSRPG